MIYVLVSLPGKEPGTWTYRLPENYGDPSSGTWCLVPLRGKVYLGVIVTRSSTKPDFKVRDILSLLPHIHTGKEWFNDISWATQHYHSPLSLMLGAAFPKWVLEAIQKQETVGEINPVSVRPEVQPLPLLGLEDTSLKVKSSPLTKKKTKVKALFIFNSHQEPHSGTQTGPVTQISESPPEELNNYQNQACQNILEAAQDKGIFKSFLLQGVTGSGKTRVYTFCAKKILAQGKNVLVLLPEIALTPQLTENFERSLGLPIHVYHSHQTDKQRKALWQDLFASKIRVLIGVRSAILLPSINFGLVIVDEEHDSSYKQTDSIPRYHARDLALVRARSWNCPVVLGSATPSLESFAAMHAGKHTLLTLPERATQQPLPQIEWIDMCQEFKQQGQTPLSRALRDALLDTLQKGHQAILLLNRRGYARRRMCTSCGEPVQCKNCSCNLIPHQKTQSLSCHHCGFQIPFTNPCTTCQSTEFVDIGLAIENLEDFLKKIFPEYSIDRLDRDSIQKAGALQNILDRFKKGETKILLGTQMVAKGHDFPNVQLVGIIDADTGLALPDFRTQERLFQLLVQVAGRAGRHQKAGRVLIQTFNPGNPLFKQNLQGNSSNFYNTELSQRRELMLPPYSRFARIEIEGQDEEGLLQTGQELYKILEQSPHYKSTRCKILGPAFPLLKKLKNKFRVYILIQALSYSELHPLILVVESFRESLKAKEKIHIDIDPQVVV